MNAIHSRIGMAVIPLCCLAVSMQASSATAEELARFSDTRIRMGIPFNITVYARDETTANAAMSDAFARIKDLNATFSDYDPRSEARKITKDVRPGEPIPISDDMGTVLARSQAFSKQTEGAFDVTVSPVVKLWRLADRSGEKPTQEAIAVVRALVGWKNLAIDPKASTVTFHKEGMELDFGAIAKGYACDEALEVLESHGITRALVEAGGDLACGDPPPGKEGWKIAVEALAKPGKTAEKLIVVKNQGVATSGDAYQFVELDGVRYSHIVDPRTGMGLTTRSSVTVIAPNGTNADALASAVSVLGPEKGKRLVESMKGVEMLMVYVNDEGKFRTVMSAGFEAYTMETE